MPRRKQARNVVSSGMPPPSYANPAIGGRSTEPAYSKPRYSRTAEGTSLPSLLGLLAGRSFELVQHEAIQERRRNAQALALAPEVSLMTPTEYVESQQLFDMLAQQDIINKADWGDSHMHRLRVWMGTTPKGGYDENQFIGKWMGGAIGGVGGAVVTRDPQLTLASAATTSAGLGELLGLASRYAPAAYDANWSGSGDYRVNVNSLINGAGGGKTESVRIRQSEYIGPLNGTTAFTVANNYLLNPGNSKIWPWLTNIARNYEEWIPHGILFSFKSSCSNQVSTAANLGNIIVATDYDVYDNPPASKISMLQMAYSNESVITEDLIHGVECDPRRNVFGRFYILHDNDVVEGSEREYHLGNVTIATTDNPTTAQIGDLWVHYDITLCKKQRPQQLWLDRWYGTASATNLYGAVTSHIDTQRNSFLYGSANTFSYQFPDTVLTGEIYLLIFRWEMNTLATRIEMGNPPTAFTGVKLLNSSQLPNKDGTFFGVVPGSIASMDSSTSFTTNTITGNGTAGVFVFEVTIACQITVGYDTTTASQSGSHPAAGIVFNATYPPTNATNTNWSATCTKLGSD